MFDSDPTTDSPDQTMPREFGTPNRFPPEVLDLSFNEAKDALDSNDINRALRIQADAAFEQIQRVE